MKIGLVTIGQSPRPDLLAPFQSRVGATNELELTGALDGLCLSQIEELMPALGEETLVTRIGEYQTVIIARERIVKFMQARVDGHQESGCDLVVVLCTGSFPELTASIPIIFPDQVLLHFVSGISLQGRLGIVAPAAEQEAMMRDKWKTYDSIDIAFLDPYGTGEILQPELDLESCDLIVLDCMGFTSQTKASLQQYTGKPIVVAQNVLAHAVGILAG